ncbi:MAG TPA: hypothetical protein V6D27_01160 [Vampirovibrionales bacterium]
MTLDFAIIDQNTVPHSTHTVESQKFPVINGVLDFQLKESQSSRSTYLFEFFVVDENETFYLENGAVYVGPTHVHEGRHYVGEFHTSAAALLFKTIREFERKVISFHAEIPPVTEVFFSDLLPTGITSNVLDTSILRIAQQLIKEPDLVQQIIDAVANANSVLSTPVGAITAPNVQAAIAQLEEFKLARQNNLAELSNPSVARGNLELESAALFPAEAFAPSSHQHRAESDLDWATEPPGSNHLTLTNAPNTISGSPIKWLLITHEGDAYVIPAWRRL